MTPLIRLAPALLAITLVLAGCRSRQPEAAPTPQPTADADTRAAADRERAEREARERAEREARERAEREARERAIAEMRNTLQQRVHFAFDSDALDGEATQRLEAKLPILQANSSVRIRIEGHTDERGSAEYNLALGQRRAAAARRFLTQRGISEGRIEITSFGEERPLAPGSGEDAWAQNRRAEFQIVAGGDQLRPPGGN
jgi:peptidoglycan-associated lipoprotein